MIEDILQGLNPAQREAVEAYEILADSGEREYQLAWGSSYNNLGNILHTLEHGLPWFKTHATLGVVAYAQCFTLLDDT